ncbi:MAG: Gfo/Idh/MocA family oxidoreductase [Pirellulaceae bacterium]|nr:Gfo/Idh/MocA family oxidoreductase [Pirellulaceae bacterium]
MSDGICRWGILSTAEIAQKNWAAMANARNARVAAVASRDVAKANSFIDLCQGSTPVPDRPTAYGSYDEMIQADSVDAVYVPLPTGLRKDWVIKVAEAGKHVLCEKPCAVNSEQLQEMVTACQQNGVQFMDGIMFMHSQRLAAMKGLLADGHVLGDIRRISGSFSFNGPEEFQAGNIRTSSQLEPQGCLGDLGWYQLRFALWAMDYQMPESISCRMLSDFHRADSPHPVPMECSLDMFFANGVSVNFYSSFITEHQQVCTVAGTKGFLRIDDFVLPFYGNRLNFEVFQSNFVVDGCDFSMERHTDQHATAEYSNNKPGAQESLLFECFSDLVLQNKTDPFWPDASLKTQRLLDLAMESALGGGKVLTV